MFNLIKNFSYQPFGEVYQKILPKKRAVIFRLQPFYRLAGEQGFEPWLAESESAVLPLDDSPNESV
jgi:hypothetical protein